MRKLFPLLLALLGTAAGVGAGLALQSSGEDAHAENPCGDVSGDVASKNEKPMTTDSKSEFAKMHNQFVVPVVNGDRVRSLVVLSLSVEVPEGQTDTVIAQEPKLRDVFLQVLFDHANVGGFDGAFTRSNNLDVLRQSLREAARKLMPDRISDVLITEIARQDI